MALEAPLRSSVGSTISGSSLQGDMSLSSPDSPAVRAKSMSMPPVSSPAAVDAQSLRPFSFLRANSGHLMSPNSDIVGPSPVTSNGTETTEIDDDEVQDESHLPRSTPSQLLMLRTSIPDHLRHSLGEEAVSVIHAPESFQNWKANGSSKPGQPGDKPIGVISPPASETSTTKSPTFSTPPPISTNVRPVKYSIETATPQAQNLQDVLGDTSRLRSSSASSLSLIPENQEAELLYADAEEVSEMEEQYYSPPPEETEVQSLRTALEECWTLCNTLANLSSIHRARVFNSSGTPDAHEKAWKSCWKLCRRLYHSRDEPTESLAVRMNLDLCRDFCQSLFDVRQRQDEMTDSVLRVSFELNNHLYSAQDSRNLPEAFRERTLDFYITLCHRLMKQRGDLAEETDSLLRACWSLAEMLFSLRQNKRDGRVPDEELLGSAVQACWELCDIFREGWTQVRPDRGTPRPTQVSFFAHSVPSDVRSSAGSRTSLHSKRESLKGVVEEHRSRKHPLPVPETPVTEFEDTPISPESSSPQMPMPNIMVLGTSQSDNGRGGAGRWSSSASQLSSYSQSSAKTSSTATTTTSAEDINITRLKMLILKAAMNIGFSRDAAAADGHGGTTSLQAFVKSLPTGSFGSLPAHSTLLQHYKNLVLADNSLRTSASLPSRGKRVSATDVAKSIGWMMLRSGQYSFLRDLFRLVFGFPVEEAENRKTVTIAV